MTHAVAETAALDESDPVRHPLTLRLGSRARRAAVGAVAAGMLVVTAAAGHAMGGREPGAYPPDRSLSPADVVRAYVDAINRRDGARFCSVVAPWISGRFDLWGNDPDSSVLRPIECPQIVSGLIGYIEDCCPPKFVSYEIVRLGPSSTDGGLQRVDVELRVHVEEDKKPKTMPLRMSSGSSGTAVHGGSRSSGRSPPGRRSPGAPQTSWETDRTSRPSVAASPPKWPPSSGANGRARPRIDGRWARFGARRRSSSAIRRAT